MANTEGQKLRNLLNELEKLVEETSGDVLQESRLQFDRIWRALRKNGKHRLVELVRDVDKQRSKIEEYSRQPVKEAITSQTDWRNIDIRVLDNRLAETKHTLLTKFRKGLAQRSLATDFDAWERSNCHSSRLDSLYNDPKLSETRHDSNMPSFMQAEDMPREDCVERGIQHGVKLLLFERIAQCSGVSAVLFFVFSRFRDVTFSDLQDLAVEIKASKWILHHAATIQPWFIECIAKYEEARPNLKRKSSDYPGLSTSAVEKRLRPDRPASAQTINIPHNVRPAQFPISAQEYSGVVDSLELSGRAASTTSLTVPQHVSNGEMHRMGWQHPPQHSAMQNASSYTEQAMHAVNYPAIQQQPPQQRHIDFRAEATGFPDATNAELLLLSNDFWQDFQSWDTPQLQPDLNAR
ncbi:hypothetical protein LTR01_008875 [Friedmanniomyces endolithicus]|nr:hypothetical protein LTS09_017646 [Friedmanniomyces endolithicus]KAK0302248.1 hypothetical protein LTR01_008875 [Friedmanniomyces endolithicus]KAK0822904.1 hypothetical protein LTR73_008941 [Friedmanniomyces endolithicus]